MKKIFIILIALFIVGSLFGCATPSSIRKDGADLTFTTKGTPQEFGHCLIGQLDEKLPLNTHSLRDNPNGNITMLTKTSDGMLVLLFDINKEGNGLSISVYSEWFRYKNQPWMEIMCLKVREMLNACGAKEKLQ